MPAKGQLRRVGEVVVGFFNPGIAGWLFILFFFVLYFILSLIPLRIGKLFVEPILWLYKSRNYSVGLSLARTAPQTHTHGVKIISKTKPEEYRTKLVGAGAGI